jgi:hypothetical protein
MNFFEKFLYFIIWLLEKYQFRKYKLDENDNNKKIINSKNLENLLIYTDTGYKPISMIHKTQPYTIFKILLENGLNLKCADNHIIFGENFNEMFVKDLKVGEFVQTVNGLSKVSKITKTNSKVCMYDVTVMDENHRFYSNGILSHNTVISSIYLVWYLLFNVDRNVLLLGNTGATAKEIIEKVKVILENLPFFMKPGILKKDVYAMKFDNGCRIIGRTTTKTAAIGFTVHLLYCDEFAHIPANIIKPFWRSVYPTLSSSKISQVIITSTPNGMNLFYELYTGAVAKQNEFIDIFVHWSRVPGRDDEWRANEIANLGGDIEAFNQEYECQFLTANNVLLGVKEFQILQKLKIDFEHKQIDELDELDFDYHNLKFALDFDIDEIRDNTNFFLFTIDTSEGLGKDYSIINIYQFTLMDIQQVKKLKNVSQLIDLVVIKQVGIFKTNTLTPDHFSAFIYALAVNVFITENLVMTIEANGPGGEVIRTLYNIYGDDNEFDGGCILKYPVGEKSKRKEDGLLIHNNKPKLCADLKRFIETGKILPRHPDCIKEFVCFAKDKKGRYNASTGNDDEVMTNVLAASAFSTNGFISMAEDYLDFVEHKELDAYENLIDAKRAKNEKKLDDDFDFF